MLQRILDWAQTKSWWPIVGSVATTVAAVLGIVLAVLPSESELRERILDEMNLPDCPVCPDCGEENEVEAVFYRDDPCCADDACLRVVDQLGESGVHGAGSPRCCLQCLERRRVRTAWFDTGTDRLWRRHGSGYRGDLGIGFRPTRNRGVQSEPSDAGERYPYGPRTFRSRVQRALQ